MKLTGVLAKGVGAAGIGLMAYDALHEAKNNSQMYGIKKSTDKLGSLYCDTLFLDSQSVVKDKAKKAILNMDMDYNVDTTFYKAVGFMKSIGNSIVNNVIPLGLSALALLTKGVVSKASAIGLIGYAAMDFIGEFGHKH